MAENVSNDEKSKLEVGYRFNPTDEELLNQYLTKKVADNNFNAGAIAEVDMNKNEPWDLPGLAKTGEREWYFFSLRDKKYPTGLRTNRATVLGYWKATGKDKQIIEEHALIGMKKTLVFYIGRAPKGEKTNWVMHEYRLEDNKYINLPKTRKVEWVICRVYMKANRGKKVQIPKIGLSPVASLFVETSQCNSEIINTAYDLSQATCFSDPTQNHETIEDNNIVDSKETAIRNFSSFNVPPIANETPMLTENNESSIMVNQKVDFSLGKYPDTAANYISPMMNNNDMFHMWLENQEHSSTASGGHFNFDCSWN